MASIKKQAKEAIDELPDEKVQEALDFIEFLKKKEETETFAAKVDKVWIKIKQGFENAGYQAKDVERMIREVRSIKQGR